ncbi:hypothetical protein N9805_03715 [Paracoccaceae bacterium]|nr:hypothetical protein [Paracoccaceae bacterium]
MTLRIVEAPPRQLYFSINRVLAPASALAMAAATPALPPPATITSYFSWLMVLNLCLARHYM